MKKTQTHIKALSFILILITIFSLTGISSFGLEKPYVAELNAWPLSSSAMSVKLTEEKTSETRSFYFGGAVGSPDYLVTPIVDQFGSEWKLSDPELTVSSKYAAIERFVYRSYSEGSPMARISFTMPENNKDYTAVVDLKFHSENPDHSVTTLKNPVTVNVSVPHYITVSDGVQDSTLTMYTGDTTELKTPSKDGYTFTGWEVDGEGYAEKNDDNGSFTFTAGNSNASITAVWVKKHIHTPGKWVVTKEPDTSSEGEKTLYCAECGEIMETRVLPKVQKKVVKNVSTTQSITLNYKQSAKIDTKIDADSGAEYTVKYTSSDNSKVKVDSNGNIYAAKRGTAKVQVTVTDSYGNTVSDSCSVTVKYTLLQWIIKIFLFGWIWY